MVKVVSIVLIAGCGGLAAGWFYFHYGTSRVREGFYDGQWASTGQSTVGQEAKFFIKGDAAIDFGQIKTGQQLVREILLENMGLEVGYFWTTGEPPAGIQLDFPSDERQRVGPKSTHPIVITCVPTQPEELMRRVVVLRTSQEGRMLTFTITGKVDRGIELSSARLLWEQADDGPWTATVDLCAWVEAELEGVRVTAADRGALPEWLQIESSPLSPEELAAYEGARVGRRLRFTAQDLPADALAMQLLVDPQQRGYAPWPVELAR